MKTLLFMVHQVHLWSRKSCSLKAYRKLLKLLHNDLRFDELLNYTHKKKIMAKKFKDCFSI